MSHQTAMNRLIYESNANTAENALTSKIIERLAAPRFETQLGRYHVTEVCGCLKKSYLERVQGHDQTYKEIWIKQRGNALHRQLTYAFQGWKELPVRMAIPFENSDVTLVGHIDAYDPDEKAIIEFKSTRFVNWQNAKELLPHEHHAKQIQSYFSIWTRCYNFPLRKLYVAYVDDETPPMFFDIEPEDLTLWLSKRTLSLHKALLGKTPPLDEQNSLCNYCAFKNFCQDIRSHDVFNYPPSIT